MRIALFGRAAAVLMSGLLAAGTAHAVYRCGNVYQDTPCDDKGPQTHLTPGMKAAPSAARPSPATAVSPYASVCSRAGEEAQKVAWKREGGATQEKQLADLASGSSRGATPAIIESVYRKRGTAPEIRAAVEAECVAEKQKQADDAAILKALLESRQPGAAGVSAPAAGPAAATASRAASPEIAQKPAGPSSSCAGWRSNLDSVNAEFRRGGDAARMELLQNRRREIEQSMREGRC